jgi:hypothetical protein
MELHEMYPCLFEHCRYLDSKENYVKKEIDSAINTNAPDDAIYSIIIDYKIKWSTLTKLNPEITNPIFAFRYYIAFMKSGISETRKQEVRNILIKNGWDVEKWENHL